MKILGLDIGTTTVSAVVAEDGQVLESLTRDNDARLPGDKPWERLQDPNRILSIVIETARELLGRFPEVRRIGLTGQMHGIVYLNSAGKPVSPLYTWQDARAEQTAADGFTYAAELSRVTGRPVAPGYGMATHYYNLKNGLVPYDAAALCTIHDYAAMVLSGLTRPVTDTSDAASFGIFDVERGRFDTGAMERAGIDPAILPALSTGSAMGQWNGREVYTAIGDNQASFLGAGGGPGTMLVNVGTGSQFSVYSRHYLRCDGLETRPFPGGGYLLVGASICGGRAYALLERFFRSVGQMLGHEPESAYDAMAALLEREGRPSDIPAVTPLFQGTREDPALRGKIEGLSTDNFTPLHLIWGVMEGMAAELRGMYDQYLASGGAPGRLLGSGNGLRKNPFLRRCFSSAFGQELTMSRCREEAAAGAAIFAGPEKN